MGGRGDGGFNSYFGRFGNGVRLFGEGEFLRKRCFLGYLNYRFWGDWG